MRKLAAILAADVAGYSRLIGADEGGTLERLKALRRELIDPKIAEEHGGVFAADGHQLFERALALDPQSAEAQNRWEPSSRRSFAMFMIALLLFVSAFAVTQIALETKGLALEVNAPPTR